jgi:predicted DNA binding CopG/RHH family protein
MQNTTTTETQVKGQLITFRLPNEVKESLQAKADAQGIKLSKLLRKIIEEANK